MSLLRTVILVVALTLPATAWAGPLDAPWNYGQAPRAKGAVVEHSGGGGSVLLGLLKGWHGAISPVDGITCPSEPSCSRYAGQAVRRHGAWLGSWMAADRMIHEMSEADHAPVVRTARGYKIDDPLSANDFWLDWR
jgi:putative component of membrane protein insertase Oxa1/YidC/SpoIIIJ protein YidD